MCFWNSLAFSMIHRMLAIWSLVPLPFLNPAWTSGSSQFTLKPGLENFEHYFASMWDECNCAVGWAFFGIAFLWDWNENWPFPALWPLPFSKFSGILSAALLQHHLSGFEIAQLELSIFKKLRFFPLCPPPAKKVPSSCSFHLSLSKLSWFYTLPKPETWRSPGSLASSAQSVADCGWDRSRWGLHKPGCLSQIPYAQVSCWQVFLFVFWGRQPPPSLLGENDDPLLKSKSGGKKVCLLLPAMPARLSDAVGPWRKRRAMTEGMSKTRVSLHKITWSYWTHFTD